MSLFLPKLGSFVFVSSLDLYLARVRVRVRVMVNSRARVRFRVSIAPTQKESSEALKVVPSPMTTTPLQGFTWACQSS